jgi:hypothetical protein
MVHTLTGEMMGLRVWDCKLVREDLRNLFGFFCLFSFFEVLGSEILLSVYLLSSLFFRFLLSGSFLFLLFFRMIFDRYFPISF